ncbi:putative reverse transcriptase domain-containing protein [Tanacetum coccineum]
MLLRIVTMWVPLPKDILGASSQRPTGCLFPKIYWVPLPKDLLGASSQRYTGCLFPKTYWVPLPKDLLAISGVLHLLVYMLNNAWTWPQAWIAKAPILNLIPAPNLDENIVYCIRWRDINGVFSEFSVSRAWEAFRPRGNEVNWFRTVWFPHLVPRHSFHLWLVMRNSLKTQDKLRQWDVGINTDLNLLQCSLYNTQSDSHAHLFFECPYSSKVWKLVRHLANMELVPPILYDIVDHLQPMANKRTVRSIFGKLLLAASSYFVWLERNNRLFKNVKRTQKS